MRLPRHIVVAAALAFLAAAANGQTAMLDPTVPLTEAADGQTVALRIGEAITVQLPENATTGYRWALDTADAKLVAVREVTQAYPSGVLGSGGVATWQATALAPGTTPVTLKLWRHWEGDRSIMRRFTLHLTIAP